MAKKKQQRTLTLFPHFCTMCGKEFRPSRVDGRLCSPMCRKRLQRAAVASRGRAADAEARPKVAPPKKGRSPRKSALG